MQISGKIKKKQSVIIDANRLKSLCDIISKHCERLEFSAETYAKTKISFDNIEELLNYDNFKPRRIISLEVDGYIGFSRRISVEIGDLNFSPVVNYGSTIRCNYQLPSVDSETIFKNDIETWFQKIKSNYWFLGKFSFSGLLFIPSAFITLIRFLCGEDLSLDLSNALVLGVLLIVVVVTFVLLHIVKILDAYLLGNLFPAVVFKWGEEINRYEKWEKFRPNLLWGIIMTLLLGLVTNYLYDTLNVL